MHITLFNVMNDGMYTRVALNRKPSTSVNNLSKFCSRQHISISFSTRNVAVLLLKENPVACACIQLPVSYCVRYLQPVQRRRRRKRRRNGSGDGNGSGGGSGGVGGGGGGGCGGNSVGGGSSIIISSSSSSSSSSRSCSGVVNGGSDNSVTLAISGLMVE